MIIFPFNPQIGKTELQNRYDFFCLLKSNKMCTEKHITVNKDISRTPNYAYAVTAPIQYRENLAVGMTA